MKDVTSVSLSMLINQEIHKYMHVTNVTQNLNLLFNRKFLHFDVPVLALSVLLHYGRALRFVINMSILFDLRNNLALEAGYVGVVGDGDEDVLVLRVLLHQSLARF